MHIIIIVGARKIRSFNNFLDSNSYGICKGIWIKTYIKSSENYQALLRYIAAINDKL
jgi:hypothetical protein